MSCAQRAGTAPGYAEKLGLNANHVDETAYLRMRRWWPTETPCSGDTNKTYGKGEDPQS